MLSASAIALLAGGAFAGGFISGLAGFGTGLIALGFWLHVVEPAAAATLVAICSVAAQAQNLPGIWPAVDHRRVWPMVIAGLIGIPLGTLLLTRMDLDSFRLGIGLLLLGYAAFMLLGRFQPRIGWGGRIADAAVGFGGGVLGGLAGLSGPLPTIWATLRGWGKDQRRGVFQLFNLAILGAVVLWHAASGLVTARLGMMVAIALPGTFAGACLGIRAYRRLSDRHFQDVVLVLLALSGATLVWNALR